MRDIDKQLIDAATAGDVNACNRTLESGADVETQYHNGRTPLMSAARWGHESVCRLLLEYGAELECTDQKGYTATDLAQQWGHAKVVALLQTERLKQVVEEHAPTSASAAPVSLGL